MTEKGTEYRLTIMPQMSLGEAVARYNATVEFVKAILRKDIDFGVIPGTGKPTLLKPGAEKLATFFGFSTRFNLMDKLEDWDKGRFHYRYACELWRAGQFIASSEGSCNSLEKKYRFRHLPSFKATDDEKSRAVKSENKTDKNGKSYQMLTLENDDPFTLVNTLQKMAQKRSLIAAVLVAVNASEFFTQDIEDMAIEGEFTEITEDKSAPHWIDDPKTKAGCFAWLKEKSLSHEDALRLLKIKGIHEFAGTRDEFKAAVMAAIHDETEAAKTPAEAVPV